MKIRKDIYSKIEDINKQNPQNKVLQGYKILLKLLQNIHNNPSELKFRLIKTENTVIKSNLLNLKKITELILYLGYTESNNFYEYKEDKMDKIDICIGVLNQYIEKIGEKEYEKEAVKTILNNNIEAQQEKEKILKKLEDEKKAKEQILALIEQDKIDRALKAKFSK